MRENPPRAHERTRHDRNIEETAHDPYHARNKPPEPAVCPRCAVVYHKGRWQRMVRPEGAHEHVCPACHRISDRNPAGYVTLSGGYLKAHREEILRLVHNEEGREAERHPLQRIMDVEENGETVTITTTDVHLARRIGDAVNDAHDGTLEIKYSPGEVLVRIDWRR